MIHNCYRGGSLLGDIYLIIDQSQFLGLLSGRWQMYVPKQHPAKGRGKGGPFGTFRKEEGRIGSGRRWRWTRAYAPAHVRGGGGGRKAAADAGATREEGHPAPRRTLGPAQQGLRQVAPHAAAIRPQTSLSGAALTESRAVYLFLLK